MRRPIAWAVFMALLLSAAVGLTACRRGSGGENRTDTNAGSASEVVTNPATPTTEQPSKEEPTTERPTEEQPTKEQPTAEPPTTEPPTTEQPTEPPVPDDWKDPLEPPAEDDGNWTPRL